MGRLQRSGLVVRTVASSKPTQRPKTPLGGFCMLVLALVSPVIADLTPGAARWLPTTPNRALSFDSPHKTTGEMFLHRIEQLLHLKVYLLASE